MRAKMLSVMGLAALATACGDTPNAPSAAARVVAFPDQLVLYVGETGSVTGQLLDGGGKVQPNAVLAYASDDARVASVSPQGAVLAIAPGTTGLVVSHGAARAVVPVTVRADERGALAELDLLPQVLNVDKRNGEPVIVLFRAVDRLGRSICDRVPLAVTSNQSLVRVENHIRGPLACELWLTHLSAGESTITVASGTLADSVRLRVVSSGYTARFVSRPLNVRAGERAAVTARLLDPFGRPMANQRVWFSATSGSLSAGSTLTDTSGTAALVWTAPTQLQTVGGGAGLILRVEMPDGVVAVDSAGGSVRATDAAQIHFYANDGNGWTSASRAVYGQIAGRHIAVAAIATDRYGNATMDIDLTPGYLSECSAHFSNPVPTTVYATRYQWCYARGLSSGYGSWFVARSGTAADTLVVYEPTCGRYGCLPGSVAAGTPLHPAPGYGSQAQDRAAAGLQEPANPRRHLSGHAKNPRE